MKAHFTVAGALVGALVSTASTVSFAQQDAPATTAGSEPATNAAHVERQADPGPNADLIGAGLVTFGLAYLPATIVASSSDIRADQHMYVPVAGPWLDMSSRPLCGGASACDTETGFKVLLAADGIIQGLGALMTLAGILSPEPSAVSAPAALEKPTMQLKVTPAHVGSFGYGLAAFGKF
jgi:hypothetical protein